MTVFCEARNSFISLGLKHVERYLCYIKVSVDLNLFSLLFPLHIISRVTEVSKSNHKSIALSRQEKEKYIIFLSIRPPTRMFQLFELL